MAQTIGNPGSWVVQGLRRAGLHASDAGARMGMDAAAEPIRLRRLEMADISAALAAGWRDFQACRTDVMALVLLYPVMGLLLLGFGLQGGLLPLLVPMLSGFALLGPVAAVGLYEISRRREAGETVSWLSALAVVERPRFGAVLVLGLGLGALFAAWLASAAWIHAKTLGPEVPGGLMAFLAQAFGSTEGWTMMLLGSLVGFVFALVALAVSVVSFPLLLDRAVGLPVAVATSLRVTRENPRVILSWGALVAGLLVLGSLPLLLGLVVVLPLLGHATWHLYRRAVA